MPKAKQAPVILTLQQKVQSWRHRAQNLRNIADTSNDPTARKILTQRAEVWEQQADEAERDGVLPPGTHI